MTDLFQDMIDKPFEKYSSGPDTYDCYGVCEEASRRLGKPIPVWKEMAANTAEAIRKCKDLFVKVDRPEPGDIIMFRAFREDPHFAIVINKTEFLHVSERTHGVKRISLSHPVYKLRMIGFYRYVGL